MMELRFKQGAYKYYSPWLFRCYKFAAQRYSKNKRIAPKHVSEVTQFYWDGYLTKKLAQEATWRGMELYTPPLKAQSQKKQAFILGCGSSINDITSEQWQEIKKNYSVGLNNFYVHEFVADSYFCEFANNKLFKKLIQIYLFDESSKAKAKVRISGRYVLFRDDGTFVVKRPNLTFYITRKVKCTDLSVLKHMVTPELYFANPYLTHHISNLDTVIHHCVREGYKEIVLMGVDLTNDGYFWDDLNTPAAGDARVFIDDFHKQVNYKKNSQGHHATASKEVAERLGKLTIVDYLSYLQKHILLPQGIKLQVGNQHSLLASILDTAEWRDTKSNVT